MARKTTVTHPRCPPFVWRGDGRIEIAMPVIRPDGEPAMLRRTITPRQALAMAAELLAGAADSVLDAPPGMAHEQPANAQSATSQAVDK